MKGSVLLEVVYVERLAELLAAEKKYLVCFKKLVELASTDELRRAISPEQTDQELHTGRISECIKHEKARKTGAIGELDACLLKLANGVIKSKVNSLEKDLNILQVSQQIMQQKAQAYMALKSMTDVLQQEVAGSLLAQCSSDEQNSIAYLSQISQNIIYPNANASKESDAVQYSI